MRAGARIQEAIRRRNDRGEPALAPFITAGFPDRDGFPRLLAEIEAEGDLVEIGVPFSDPMADGVTIQRSSRAALDNGVHLDWILGTLSAQPSEKPRVLMSYYNPLLAYGFDRLAVRAGRAGIDALIVPDLPFEEQGDLRAELFAARIGIVQLVTPVTPKHRRRSLAEATAGFLYAVTVTGTTGAGLGPSTGSTAESSLAEYLDDLAKGSESPVLAGFGVRTAEQLAQIGRHAAGAIVGSALIEAIEAGESPRTFLRALRSGERRPMEVSS